MDNEKCGQTTHHLMSMWQFGEKFITLTGREKIGNPLAQWASKFQFSLAQWERNMPYQLK